MTSPGVRLLRTRIRTLNFQLGLSPLYELGILSCLPILVGASYSVVPLSFVRQPYLGKLVECLQAQGSGEFINEDTKCLMKITTFSLPQDPLLPEASPLPAIKSCRKLLFSLGCG